MVFGVLRRLVHVIDKLLSPVSQPSDFSGDDVDIHQEGFPLAPDDFHLQHVGRTKQGNGYWITSQLVSEDLDTRDFVAAYVFDRQGNLISCEVVDLGGRRHRTSENHHRVVATLLRKIDADRPDEIRVKPFSRTFYGHEFGLIVRSTEVDTEPGAVVVDAMPGHTLMFHGPWSHCNYAS